MDGIDRHLVVLGCGLVATALLAFGGGLATAAWLAVTPGSCEATSPVAGDGGGNAGPLAAGPGAGGLPAAMAADTAPDAGRSAPSPEPSVVTGAGRFHVQIGSFLDGAAADAIAARLAERGYQAGLAKRTDRTGIVWHTPVVGVYESRGVAVEAAREVGRRVGLDARMVALARDPAS